MSWGDVDKEEQGRGQDPDYPLSPSALKTYMRCPKQYEYAYMKGIKNPPNFKMVFGSSIHRGLEVNYAHKFKKKKDLPIKDVLSIFNDDIKVRVKRDSIKLDKSEMNSAVAEGVDILTGYHKTIAPGVQPTHQPELELSAPVPGAKRKLRGFIDLVADVHWAGVFRRSVVRDTKTTSRKYTQEQTDTDIQLTVYDYLLKAVHKIKASAVQFDVVVRSKAGVAFQTLTSRRPLDSHKRLESTVQQIEKSIKAGIFYPTDDYQRCGWCGYREQCHKGVSWSR